MTEENMMEDGGNGVGLDALNFNVNDEYKPNPLIPKGTYHAVVTKVTFEPAKSCIVWDLCLHDNGGMLTDGSTPVDGAHQWFRNWLPKPGDEDEMTASGKSTKRQSKINMLKDFSVSMEIDMSTPQKIATALAEGEWIGIEVDVDIDSQEYMGKVNNITNKMRRSKMY